MQSSQISTGPPAGQKTFVFVDEYNRHKRLKVMRACEECRRRKIKCDSATTNTWPCAPCVRSKSQCVPPVAGTENDTTEYSQYTESDEWMDASTFDPAIPGPYHRDPASISTTQNFEPPQTSGIFKQEDVKFDNSALPQMGSYNPNLNRGYALSISSKDPYVPATFKYPQPTISADQSRRESSLNIEPDYTSAEDLSDRFGILRIAENGVAPYLRPESKQDIDAPIQEPEVDIPVLSPGPGSQIRIPHTFMPSEKDALYYFDIFFRDVHPYVPVINRTSFYNRWNSNRASLSPLLLEAIFACTGMIIDANGAGAQWLALANKHEEAFLDKPRLSTLQASILLLKAREGSPKRGYYYRSWMTIKSLVSSAKSLDLHEHHDIHREGESCGSDPVECLTKTRVWQSIFAAEVMVGGSQGRSDMGVDPSTVDISLKPPFSDLDPFEKPICRQFAYFIRNIYNIRLITDSSHRLKRKKDWGLDPDFVAYNANFKNWPHEIPPDLQISLPVDGSAPILPSHFVGNMHSHHILGEIMLHRPQLVASKSFATDEAWKQQMTLCYNNAKTLCRIQEALLQVHGLTGLQYMIRGINFNIYAILTCIMVHLIALTSPDPDFNIDARDFFTRHMRILERCITLWKMPETEEQVNALRLAFSADINRPFELKPYFPFGSPSAEPSEASPLPSHSENHFFSQNDFQYASHLPPHLSGPNYMPTPPLSIGANDSNPDSPRVHQDYITDPSTYALVSSAMYHHTGIALDNSQWNPTPIINQFDNAFGIPPSALLPPSQGGGSQVSPALSYQSLPQSTQVYASPYPSSSYSQPYQQSYQDDLTQLTMPQQMHQTTVPDPTRLHTSFASPAPVYVSAKDWQKSVASVFDPAGLKRRWVYDDESFQKRMRGNE